MQAHWKHFRALTGAAVAVTLLTQALPGAGFILHEHSISGLGVGFASGAAGLDDNSSMFFNPATLSLVDEPQITSGLHLILPQASFKNDGSLSGFNGQTGVPTQGPDAKSDAPAIVPNLYYSRPLSEDLFLGFGLNSPYGLATSYDEGWVGRYVALETDMLTVNANLALAWKLSEKITLGFGVSGVYADALLSNAINFGTAFLSRLGTAIPVNAQTQALAQDIQANLGGTKYDGSLELTGDDFGYGYNFGILFQPNEGTRIGLHYRSKVDLTLSGNADFTVGALDPFFGALFADQGGSVDISLPDTAQVSIHQHITADWAVMADLFHTWWSKFDELNIRFADGLLPNSVIPERWNNSWRYSVGSTYQLNEAVQLRAGLVWDESPVPSATYRSPRIPDEDRLWVSLGLGFRISEALVLDIAYVHIFVDDPVIDNPTHTAGEYLRGTMDARVDILSIGGSWRF